MQWASSTTKRSIRLALSSSTIAGLASCSGVVRMKSALRPRTRAIASRRPCPGPAPLLARQPAVDRRPLHPALLELVGLVFHQCDQRRDHDRGTAHLQRRQLVAERLAGAGRHDGERVAPGEHAFDDLALTRTQAAQAEAPPQQVLEAFHYFARTRMARSRPSRVVGYMCPFTSSLRMAIDWR